MTLRQVAASLARQMTLTGVTPENVTGYHGYVRSAGCGFLKYAYDDSRHPVLGWPACSLMQDGDSWQIWDEYGSKGLLISYVEGSWVISQSL